MKAYLTRALAPLPLRIALVLPALLVPLVAWRIYWLPDDERGSHLRLLFASISIGFTMCGALAWAIAASLRRAWPPTTVKAATVLVVFVHAIFLAGTFPGLMVSDALYVYHLGRTGSIGDGYGYLWPLTLHAALALVRHPATISALQLLYFAALIALMGGWLARRRSPGLAAGMILVVGMWPAVVLSVTYQHRDVAAALLAFHWALHAVTASRDTLEAHGRDAFTALAAHALLLLCFALLRPDFTPVALTLLAVIAWARWRRKDNREAKIAMSAALAVVAAVPLYGAAVRSVVEVRAAATPYLVTLFIQPAGHILAKGSAARIPEGTNEAFDRIFEPGKLAAMAQPRNIFILWSPHLRHPEDPRAYRDFYVAALRLIAANPFYSLENRWQVYLGGNGFGGVQEIHQDQAGTKTYAKDSGFDGTDRRPPILARLALRLMAFAYGEPSLSFPRVVLWNTLPLLLLAALALAAFPLAHGAWLVALALLARAATLFVAAPATQYAYHFPVMLMGMVLLAAFMGRRHDG